MSAFCFVEHSERTFIRLTDLLISCKPPHMPAATRRARCRARETCFAEASATGVTPSQMSQPRRFSAGPKYRRLDSCIRKLGAAPSHL